MLGDIWNEPGLPIVRLYGKGLKSFYGWPTNRIVMGVLRDPANPILDYHQNTDKSSFVSTYRGRQEVTNDTLSMILSSLK